MPGRVQSPAKTAPNTQRQLQSPSYRSVFASVRSGFKHYLKGGFYFYRKLMTSLLMYLQPIRGQDSHEPWIFSFKVRFLLWKTTELGESSLCVRHFEAGCRRQKHRFLWSFKWLLGEICAFERVLWWFELSKPKNMCLWLWISEIMWCSKTGSVPFQTLDMERGATD